MVQVFAKNFLIFFQQDILKVNTIQRYYRVDRREIFFIQSIFEGYDGLATMSTVDPNKGVIRLSIPPDTEADVLDILQDLKTSGILIEAVVPTDSISKLTKDTK